MNTNTGRFYGPIVVHTAFVIGIFGWGIGFYGPPVFLHEVVERTSWPLTAVSSAISIHFIAGALVVLCMPRLHRTWGVPLITVASSIAMSVGVIGWAYVSEMWQLYIVAAISGSGWVGLGAAGINAMVSPWYSKNRPRALAAAYNGASLGGLIFTPLWGTMKNVFGFQIATILVGTIVVLTISVLSLNVLRRTPSSMGQVADGEERDLNDATSVASYNTGKALSTSDLIALKNFRTLAVAMALGLFAQIGLVAHLYSLLIPKIGIGLTGWAMGVSVGLGILGRTASSKAMSLKMNRRIVLASSYVVQSIGTLIIFFFLNNSTILVLVGILLFGIGIGNSSSMPPLIAQSEFSEKDVPKVVAICIAFAQILYAFAPALFAVILEFNFIDLSRNVHTNVYFICAFSIQLLAAICIYSGRQNR